MVHKSGWNAKVTAMSRDHALLQAFASELKAQRSALKLSQEEFAHRADVNRTYVAKLELAQNQPTLSVMLRLAVALNNELPDLIQAVMRRYKRSPPEFLDLQADQLAPAGSKSKSNEPNVSSSALIDLTHENSINLDLDHAAWQLVSARNRKVIVEFDVMMSSKLPFIYRMVEIAAVEILDGKVSGSTFHAYLNPGVEVDSNFPSRHKWPHEFLGDKPRFIEIANTLVNFINGSELLTHRDYPYLDQLNQELISAGFASLNQICSNISGAFVLARKLLKIKSPTFEKLCDRFEVDPKQHRLFQGCMSDARILAEIYVKMCPIGEVLQG